MNERGLVSALAERARPFVTAIKERHVTATERLHHARHRVFGFRCAEDVDVISHQRVRMHFEAVAFALESQD